MIAPTALFRAATGRRVGTLLCALLTVGPAVASGQEDRAAAEPGAEAEEEDRRISEYDFAVSHAMRALMAANPEQRRVTVYVARKEGDRWHVYFGSYDVRRRLFRIAYEVIQEEAGSSRFSVREYREDVVADAELNRQATALVTALEAFEPRSVRFKTYVWRKPDGQWVAYFVPVSLRHPLRERLPAHPTIDQRVLLSPDARRILETRNYLEADSAEWELSPSPPSPSLADLLPVLLDPELGPVRLIGQSLVCEINWRGEFESCLIAPPH